MRALLGLYAPTLAISFAQGMIFPAVPTLAQRFAVSPGTAAQVVTAQVVGRLVGLVPAGVLVDRLGPWAVLLLGSACLVGGAALMLVPAFWTILVGQAITGLGSSLWVTGREIQGLGLVRADQRGRLMSGFFGLQTAGLAAGPVAGGLLLEVYGLRALFGTYGGIGGGVLVITLLLRRLPGASPHRRADRTAASPAAPAAAPGRLLFGGWREVPARDRQTFAIIVFATFAMSVYRTALNSLLPLYAGTTLGFGAVDVGALFGIVSVGVLVMMVPAGLILDRVGRKWGAVPAAALPAAVFTAMPLATTRVDLSLAAAVLGVANGLSLGSMSTFSYDVIPAQARGRLQALRRVIGDLGGVLGPVTAGVLADRYGPRMAFPAYVPLLGLTALLVAFGTRETLTDSGAGSRTTTAS